MSICTNEWQYSDKMCKDNTSNTNIIVHVIVLYTPTQIIHMNGNIMMSCAKITP